MNELTGALIGAAAEAQARATAKALSGLRTAKRRLVMMKKSLARIEALIARGLMPKGTSFEAVFARSFAEDAVGPIQRLPVVGRQEPQTNSFWRRLCEQIPE